MTHLDLCSGIGGFALAARTVWGDQHRILAFCEIDPFCGSILTKRWPETPLIQNIFDLDGTQFPRPDILTAGFPCQPFSTAGKRKGTRDDRDLWPEVFRIVQESRPRWCCFENVAGFLSMGFDRTKTDLESEGYEVGEPLIIPACAVDAPHRRDRVWVIAYISNRDRDGESQRVGDVEEKRGRISDGREAIASNADGIYADNRRLRASEDRRELRQAPELQRSEESLSNTTRCRRQERDECDDGLLLAHTSLDEALLDADGERCEELQLPNLASDEKRHPVRGQSIASHWSTPSTIEGYRVPSPQSGIRVLAHGVPGRVARLKALGNAIVPQVAVEIFRAINAVELQEA